MKKNISVTLGAAFLMATSAIGPGFLTQTTVFTSKLLYSFSFVIILSVIIDIIAQITIWRTLTVANLRAQDLGNKIYKNLGNVLSLLITFGGIVFNIGNLAGTGLGLEAMFGIPTTYGAIISVFIVLILLNAKNKLNYLDGFVNLLGLLMVVILVYLTSKTNLEVMPVIMSSFYPTEFDLKATITLVGGTVGGYITFAGAHRLIDANIVGAENLKRVTKSAYTGIIITATIRFLLFFVTLGVVIKGFTLNLENPTSSVFEFTLGDIGKKVFGLMIWVASITSVLGATYTSISFLKTTHKVFENNQKYIALLFSFISITILILFGKPILLLLFAGYINGFILPIGLGIVLLTPLKLLNTEKPVIPIGLKILGWLVVVLMFGFAVVSIFT